MRDTVQRNFYFLARRFVAGDNIGDAIAAVRKLNSQGMSATLDFLGEDVHVTEAALRTREAYEEILDAIAQSGVDSNVSVKLTAMGLLIDEKFALDNLVTILQRAANNRDPFVRIDMEGSSVVEATLRVFAASVRDALQCRARTAVLFEAHARRRGKRDRASRSSSAGQGRLQRESGDRL